LYIDDCLDLTKPHVVLSTTLLQQIVSLFFSSDPLASNNAKQ